MHDDDGSSFGGWLLKLWSCAMQTWTLDFGALEVVKHCQSPPLVMPLIIFTRDLPCMNCFFMIDYKNASICQILHNRLQFFFLIMLWFQCFIQWPLLPSWRNPSVHNSLKVHRNGVVHIVVATSHCIWFLFLGPFEIANCGVSCSDSCCHPNMILMLVAHWNTSWWCCAQYNYNNSSHLFWSIWSCELTIVTCVSCNHWYIAIVTNHHHHHHLNNFGDGVITHCKQQAITIAICDFFWCIPNSLWCYYSLLQLNFVFIYFGTFEDCCHML